MPSHFKTLGPFELIRKKGVLEKESLKNIWKDREVRYAVGVYVIAFKRKGQLVPIYVGKSDRGFANRLNKHSIFEDIAGQMKNGNLYLFLIAAVTPKGKLKKSSRRVLEKGEETRSESRKSRAIEKVEFALIGKCSALNSDLLNMQQKKFHEGLVVPGFLNDDGIDMSPAAKALHNMLGQ